MLKRHWKTLKCIENTLISFKIHCNTSKNLKDLWHILQYHYNTLIYFHVLLYTLKLSKNPFIPHFSILLLFHLITLLYYKTIMAPHFSSKNILALAMTYLLKFNKWGISHESYKRTVKLRVPKKVVRPRISANVSVSNKSVV
jgi:hypothetical protein